MIQFKNVTKHFDKSETPAVNNLSFEIEENKITVLVGPSGCGKTTTLRMINRLADPTSGDILLRGKAIRDINRVELRRQIGYVIQETGLFPHLTIFENIAVTPRLLKWPKKKITSRVMELLDLINLDPNEFAKRYPIELSGGQRQRVGVVRALAADPDILLMDEPFGAVDPINRESIQDAFMEIQETLKKTIVMVTHDIREAVKMGDRISIMNQGEIVQYDKTDEIVKNPINQFVENLLGTDRAFYSLETVRIRDILSHDFVAVTKAEAEDRTALIQRLKQEKRNYAFLLDERKRLKGYISLHALEHEENLDDIVRHIDTVKPISNLREAMTHIVSSGVATLPVADDRGRMHGVIHLRKALNHIEMLNREEDSAS